jgi:hypothetical protein
MIHAVKYKGMNSLPNLDVSYSDDCYPPDISFKGCFIHFVIHPRDVTSWEWKNIRRRIGPGRSDVASIE